MGYETRFKLTALTNRNYSQRDYLKILAEIDLQKLKNSRNLATKMISLKFPDTYFLLYGVGEEQGDVWKAYFYNGKVQIIKATLTFKDEQFHPFDL